MFTKIHYIEIAKILKNSNTKEDIINKIIGYFQSDNPLFDKVKFLNAVCK